MEDENTWFIGERLLTASEIKLTQRRGRKCVKRLVDYFWLVEEEEKLRKRNKKEIYELIRRKNMKDFDEIAWKNYSFDDFKSNYVYESEIH